MVGLQSSDIEGLAELGLGFVAVEATVEPGSLVETVFVLVAFVAVLERGSFLESAVVQVVVMIALQVDTSVIVVKTAEVVVVGFLVRTALDPSVDIVAGLACNPIWDPPFVLVGAISDLMSLLMAAHLVLSVDTPGVVDSSCLEFVVGVEDTVLVLVVHHLQVILLEDILAADLG